MGVLVGHLGLESRNVCFSLVFQLFLVHMKSVDGHLGVTWGALGVTWGSLEGHLGSLERHLGVTLENEVYMLRLGGAKKRKC